MANIVSLHCPHCGQKLKIKDASLFGQSVKCPGCKKPFVLHDPNAPASSIELELETPIFPDVSSGKQSTSAHEAPLINPNSNPMDFLQNQDSPKSSSSVKFESPIFSSPPLEQPVVAPIVSAEEASPSGTAALSRLRQRRKTNKWVGLGLISGVVLLTGGMIGYFMTRPEPETEVIQMTKITGVPTDIPRPVNPNEPYSQALLASDAELVQEFEPTAGDPIQLFMMPSGVNLLIHLRPAELWSDDYDYRVLRASLTDDVMSWLGEQIKSLCLRDPAQIEDLTIGVILGARGTSPQYCAVVKLVQPEKLSTLIELFPGKYLYPITERPDLRLKVDDQHGYLIHDEQTYAICPASMASELEYSIEAPNPDVTVGMEQMLKLSDRDRLFTAIANMRDLEIHLKSLLPVAAQPFLRAAADWLGEDVETVSWSLHPNPYFHSELVLRPVSTREVVRLEKDANRKLTQLPETVWKDLCVKMQPREVRFRKLIGRLPAMLEAFQESTVSNKGDRRVVLTTVLPAKATPNLALATLFTVNEAARTNFAPDTAMASEDSKPKLPETVAERMKTVIVDAEFNRTPLEQALTYLSGEIQVNLHVDGDALKDAGYTKNMPQTFNLGKVPMQQALSKIVDAYQEAGKEMVISVNEETKTITVLTLKFAEKEGLPVYPLK